MTFEGLLEMFEGDRRHMPREISACIAEGQAEGLVCADPGARMDPIGWRYLLARVTCLIFTILQKWSHALGEARPHGRPGYMAAHS